MSVAIDYETASACPLCKYLKTVYVWVPPEEWERLHLVDYSPSTITLTTSVKAAVKEFLSLVKEKEGTTQTALEKWGITPTLIERHRPIKVTVAQKVAWRQLRAQSIAHHVAQELYGPRVNVNGRRIAHTYWWNRFTDLLKANRDATSDSYLLVDLKRKIKTRMQKLKLTGKELTELSVSLTLAHLKEIYDNERTRPEGTAVEGGVEEALG